MTSWVRMSSQQYLSNSVQIIGEKTYFYDTASSKIAWNWERFNFGDVIKEEPLTNHYLYLSNKAWLPFFLESLPSLKFHQLTLQLNLGKVFVVGLLLFNFALAVSLKITENDRRFYIFTALKNYNCSNIHNLTVVFNFPIGKIRKQVQSFILLRSFKCLD